MSARSSSLVQVYLAGFAAEHLLSGRRSRQLDQEIGFAIVARLDPDLSDAFEGSDERDGFKAVREVLRTASSMTDYEIRSEVDRFYEIAKQSLSSVWGAVEAMANVLLIHEELDRTGVDEALNGVDIYQPVFAIQRAHGLLGKAPIAPDEKRC